MENSELSMHHAHKKSYEHHLIRLTEAVRENNARGVGPRNKTVRFPLVSGFGQSYFGIRGLVLVQKLSSIRKGRDLVLAKRKMSKYARVVPPATFNRDRK